MHKRNLKVMYGKCLCYGMVSKECEQLYPNQRSAIVTIKKKDGTQLEKQVRFLF
jgi:hypothetical protein